MAGQGAFFQNINCPGPCHVNGPGPRGLGAYVQDKILQKRPRPIVRSKLVSIACTNLAKNSLSKL